MLVLLTFSIKVDWLEHSTQKKVNPLPGGIKIHVAHDLIFCLKWTMVSQEYKITVARRAREENAFCSLGITNFIWRTGEAVLTT